MGVNILLLCKHQYFLGDGAMQVELEVYMKLVVYFMLILMVLRFVAEIKVAIECKCGSTVVPQEQVEGEQPSVQEGIEAEGHKKKQNKHKKKGKDKKKKNGKDSQNDFEFYVILFLRLRTVTSSNVFSETP